MASAVERMLSRMLGRVLRHIIASRSVASGCGVRNVAEAQPPKPMTF